jgi:hypothetical protein
MGGSQMVAVESRMSPIGASFCGFNGRVPQDVTLAARRPCHQRLERPLDAIERIRHFVTIA